MRLTRWSLVHGLSRLLEPDERDAVLGDLAESNVRGEQALWEMFGLIVRRQAASWKDWRPWLALVGIVSVAGTLLIDFSIFLGRMYELYSWIFFNYGDIDPAILTETGLTLPRGIVLSLLYSFVLLFWSWSSGVVLGLVARRTIWVNGAVFGLIWFYVSGALLAPAIVMPTFLLLLSAIFGIRQGRRWDSLSEKCVPLEDR